MSQGRGQLIEPVPLPDLFITGIHAIENLGACSRFILYSDQVLYEVGATPVRVAVAKIVMPRAAILPCAHTALVHVGVRCAGMAGHLRALVNG